MVRESSREIDVRASEWLAQRDAGQWTGEDESRFQAWLNESTLHRVEFLRIEAAWNETRRMKALAAGIQSERPPKAGQWNLSPFFEAPDASRSAPENLRVASDDSCVALNAAAARDSGNDADTIERNSKMNPSAAVVSTERRGQPVPTAISRTRAWALAASLLLVVAGGLLAWNRWPTGQQYSTPIGGTASVPLSDGSQVTLNTRSQIRVSLGRTERHVDLEQGEAFFQVAHDPQRPFVVEAGKKRVVAVGTQFSVRREGDAIRIVVTEGKVRVEDDAAPLRSPAVEPSGSTTSEGVNGPVFLTSGSVARAGDAGVLVQRKTIPEAEEALSWRSGMLTFRDETLADAIAEFNRYSERQVVIEDPSVAALKIEGNFRSNNIAAFLELLQRGYPVQVTQESDRYVLRAR